MSGKGVDRIEWFAWCGDRIIGVQVHEPGDTIASVARTFRTADRIELIQGQDNVSVLMKQYIAQLGAEIAKKAPLPGVAT